MFGDNVIRKPRNDDDSYLEVKSIFPTLQGEGIFTGWPSVFLRLGGCNLSCSFCDTEFEDFSKLSLDDIINEIHKLSLNDQGDRVRKLVVITGGEPMRQPIERICRMLLDNGFSIQIETNGTLYRNLPKEVDIVCSPKITNGRYHPIRADLLPKISAFKFIISKTLPYYDDVTDVGQSEYQTPVYVQPMDEYNEAKNQQNRDYTVELALNKGYRLSLQTHKIINIE
ncbi:MAG: 7-carboxy-7-deazaguanine synthase QueE [Rickettsiales bacterium]|nr:7-carboxy-7-deazaguanine synthase QueE [Rickettsiales bacterium]